MRVTTSESQVLRACLDLLLLRAVPHWRNNSGALRNATGRPVRFGIKGSADIIGILPRSGRFLAVEAKRPADRALGVRVGRATSDQLAFLGVVRNAGGVALLVNDVATLAAALDRLESDPFARLDFHGDRS